MGTEEEGLKEVARANVLPKASEPTLPPNGLLEDMPRGSGVGMRVGLRLA